MVDAVILAGSHNNGPLKEHSSAPYEAMITIGRKTMVEYVVDALRGSRLIHRIVVVGPAGIPGFLDREDIIMVPAEGSLMENMARGLKEIPGAGRVLVATCDIPLITVGAIEDFLEKCADMSAQLYYPVVPRDIVEKKYATTKRTYVLLREGEYTGGNLFLIDPLAVDSCMSKGQQLVDARKSPLQLSRLVGIMFLVRFLLRMVSLEEAEKKVSALLGINGAVVVTAYPEVGIDVDKPSDLELVTRYLGSA